MLTLTGSEENTCRLMESYRAGRGECRIIEWLLRKSWLAFILPEVTYQWSSSREISSTLGTRGNDSHYYKRINGDLWLLGGYIPQFVCWLNAKLASISNTEPNPSLLRVANLAGSFEYAVEDLTLKQVGHSQRFIRSALVVFKIPYLYHRGTKSFSLESKTKCSLLFWVFCGRVNSETSW